MVFLCPAQPFYFERIAKQTEQNQQDFQQLDCSLNEGRELIEFRHVAEKEDRKQSAAKEEADPAGKQEQVPHQGIAERCGDRNPAKPDPVAGLQNERTTSHRNLLIGADVLWFSQTPLRG